METNVRFQIQSDSIAATRSSFTCGDSPLRIAQHLSDLGKAVAHETRSKLGADQSGERDNLKDLE